MEDYQYDEAEEGDDVDSYVHFDLLTKFWVNEKCAPSLLEYQERLMVHTKEAGEASRMCINRQELKAFPCS